MEFRCEDLPQFGVILVPPSSSEYDRLLGDIQRRIDHPLETAPPLPEAMRPRILEEDREYSAMLLNRSQHGIAEIQQVWTFEEVNGRTYTSSIGGGANPSVLLPFGLSEKVLKLYGYWHVILPGSKALSSAVMATRWATTAMCGHRPRTKSGKAGGVSGGRGRRRSQGLLPKVTLTLDGVFFFDDGGFAGPNQKGLWEQVVVSAESHIRLSRRQVKDHDKGATPQKILAEIESVTGPATDNPPPPFPPGNSARTPEAYRESALQRLGWEIGRARNSQGDERTISMLMAWASAPLPLFRKL